MADSNLAVNSVSDANDSDEETSSIESALGGKDKKSRVGGRQRAYNEFEGILAAARESTNNPDTLDVIEELVEKVQSMRGLKTTGQNTAMKSYVAVMHTGMKVVFKCATPPTQETHGAQFTAVFGPYRSQGASFRTSNPFTTEELTSVKDGGKCLYGTVDQ